MTRKVSEAAAQGDRSENADYIYGKKQLREIDGRIAYLSKRLDVLVVVDKIPSNAEKVFFGAWVTVEDEAGQQQQYRIVGADEFDRAPEFISVDSPMARALIGKQVGDDIVLKLETPIAITIWSLLAMANNQQRNKLVDVLFTHTERRQHS